VSDESEVLDLIERWATTELSGDTAAYPSLLTADFRGIGPVGFVLDAEQWAQRHLTGLTNHAFSVSEPHLRRYGDTVLVEAVQIQRTTARGHDSSGSFRLGLVAVRTEEGWRLARVQLSGPLIAPGERPAFAR
jgi:ketosteroid isomerase-like protein